MQCNAMHRPAYYPACRTAQRQPNALDRQVLCSVVGMSLLASVLGEGQLQSMPSHTVYLLRASFSDSLMNEIWLFSQLRLIVLFLQPTRKQGFLCTTSNRHLTLCEQFLLLLITHQKNPECLLSFSGEKGQKYLLVCIPLTLHD